MKSATMIGGTSPKNKRVESDFYATPPECTIALVRYLPLDFWGDMIWEPACGAGDMCHVFESETGASVRATDLENRGYGVPGVDFLKTPLLSGVTSLVTNPPFSLAAQFISHSRAMRVPFAMLLKSTYWNAGRRKDLFRDTGPTHRLDLTWRPAMVPGLGKSPTMDFSWTVWGPTPSAECKYDLLTKPN